MNKLETATPTVPAWFDPGAVLAQYLEGKRTAEIAQALGCTRERLAHWLLTAAEDDWRAAQLARAIRRMEDAEQELDDASDMLQINKANAKLKSAQWTLERICRRIYGQDQPPSQAQALQVIINLRGQSGRVVEPCEPQDDAESK